jgi:ribosomal-protein-alanine N-acetyltransferase
VSSHELRTERLRLVALDAEEMRLLAEDWPALQRRLGAKPSPAWITDPETLAAARRHRDRMLQEADAWMWWTFWQVVVALEGETVGLVDFKGPPGPEGGVAIGCSFAPAHWNRGYATEAVGPLVAWALGHSSVRFITADTDGANVRAHRVLRKLGFVSGQTLAGGPSHHGDAGDLLAWRLVKPGGPCSGG